MRRLVVLLGGAIILMVANLGIHQKEQLLSSGRMVLLELAPVDPRSLMQGDYMALRFKVADDAFGRRPAEDLTEGRLVLTIDEKNVGRFARFDDGRPVGPQEALIKYRVRGHQPKLATNAFFFQEGQGQFYNAARFGEFRVSPSGEAILKTLRGADLEVLGPPR